MWCAAIVWYCSSFAPHYTQVNGNIGWVDKCWHCGFVVNAQFSQYQMLYKWTTILHPFNTGVKVERKWESTEFNEPLSLWPETGEHTVYWLGFNCLFCAVYWFRDQHNMGMTGSMKNLGSLGGVQQHQDDETGDETSAFLGTCLSRNPHLDRGHFAKLF